MNVLNLYYRPEKISISTQLFSDIFVHYLLLLGLVLQLISGKMPLHELKVEDIGQPRRPRTIAAWQDMTSHELDDMRERSPNIAVTRDGAGKACKCKCLQTKACKIALAVFIVLATIATIVIIALLVTGYYDERRYVFHARNMNEYDLAINGNNTGPAIHVKTGQWLSVKVENEITDSEDGNPNFGLSIHWHGLNMKGNNFLDGVVGLTQCPIEEKKSFEYRWKIDEQPGTYWYHTHDRKMFPPNQTNFIRGPLIIHPSDSKFSKPSLDPPQYVYRWDDEIIFFYTNKKLNGEKMHTVNSKRDKNTHLESSMEPVVILIATTLALELRQST